MNLHTCITYNGPLELLIISCLYLKHRVLDILEARQLIVGCLVLAAGQLRCSYAPRRGHGPAPRLPSSCQLYVRTQCYGVPAPDLVVIRKYKYLGINTVSFMRKDFQPKTNRRHLRDAFVTLPFYRLLKAPPFHNDPFLSIHAA